MKRENDFKAVKGHRHLYVSRYKTKRRGWIVSYSAVLRWWDGKDVRKNLGQDKESSLGLLRDLEERNAEREPFESTREARAKAKAEEEQKRAEAENVMTISKFSPLFLDLPEMKQGRSVERTEGLHRHLIRHLGSQPLASIERGNLFDYIEARKKEGIIRGGKFSADYKVKDGTIRNELAALRLMLNIARQYKEGFKKRGILYDVAAVSFKDVLPEPTKRKRTLTAVDEKKLFNACPIWLRRLFIVANETCLSRSDILRLTWDMIRDEGGVIVPTGGRTKTGVEQASPLTDKVREVLREIRAERKTSKVQPLTDRDLVFMRDGKLISPNMVNKARLKACTIAGVEDFRFHDFRHCAKSRWADEGIQVDVAMLAAGQKSVQMHIDYTHMQEANIAKAFGTGKKFYNSFIMDEDAAKVEVAG
jgi:integrase